MLKPKLNQLPHIYNIDKMRIYDTCGLAAEINVGGHHLLWYLENDIRAYLLLERTIDEMTICLEGCLGTVVVLEIFLK